MTTQNPMSRPDPWNMVAEGYVTDTRPVFGQYCQKAIELAGLEPGDRVIDVACGPGTMSLLIQSKVRDVQSIDFSQGMLDCFNREIGQQGIANITTHLMDGQNLDFGDNEFDKAFSIFGLMFFPDRIQGFRELYRVLKPGGTAVVSSWAPITQSTGMSLMFGAMAVAFPKKPESNRQPTLNLEDPDNFKREMSEAGFTEVSIIPFDGYWHVESVEGFFDSIVRGSAPLVMLKNNLGEAEWADKRAIMLDHIGKQLTEVPTKLNSRAFIGVGRKP